MRGLFQIFLSRLAEDALDEPHIDMSAGRTVFCLPGKPLGYLAIAIRQLHAFSGNIQRTGPAARSKLPTRLGQQPARFVQRGLHDRRQRPGGKKGRMVFRSFGLWWIVQEKHKALFGVRLQRRRPEGLLDDADLLFVGRDQYGETGSLAFNKRPLAADTLHPMPADPSEIPLTGHLIANVPINEEPCQDTEQDRFSYCNSSPFNDGAARHGAD